MKTLIRQCRIVSPDVEIARGSIEIENDKITAVYADKSSASPKGVDSVIDGSGLTAVPGFIDIHCHGEAGFDVMDCKPDGVFEIAKAKAADGVTSFCPTTLTASTEDLVAAAKTVAAYTKDEKYARCLGIHLEGPYVNPKFLGAQNPKYVRKPDANEVMLISAISKVAIVSLACEMEGGSSFIREMCSNGIVPACVHSGATMAEFYTAKAAGLKHLSHFCNQMTALHHREPGLVGAGLLDDDIKLEIICDLIHLSQGMIKLVFKNKSVDNIMLISDSMAATSLSDGNYKLGELDVVVKDSVARLASNGAIAGSTLRYYVGLKNISEFIDLPLKELIKTTSLNQARSLGIANLGKIEKGYLADIVLMNSEFVPQKVIVGGRIVK